MPIPSARELLVLLALCVLGPLSAQDPTSPQEVTPSGATAEQKAEEKGPPSIEQRLTILEGMHGLGTRHLHRPFIPAAVPYRAPISSPNRGTNILVSLVFPAMLGAVIALVRTDKLKKRVKELEERLGDAGPADTSAGN